MECQQTKELFSLWLDKQISPQEDAQLNQHLLTCSACQLELQEWQRISDILRSVGAQTDGVQAPAGFEDRVMQQIAQNSRRPRWFTINRAVKQFTAIAAAAAILIYGVADLSPRIFNNPPPIDIAGLPNPVPLVNNTGFLGEANGNEAIDQPQIGGDNPSPAGSPETGSEPSGSDPANPSPVGAIVDPNSDPDPNVLNIAEAPAESNSPGIASIDSRVSSPLVFLNKSRTISSSLLRLEVDNLASAQKQAESAAKAAAAKYQVFAVQSSGEHQRVILRIVADSNRADALIQTLRKLGSVIDTKQENQDITAKFADTLEQYRTLVAQLNESPDAKPQASLKSQIQTLEQKLQTWDEEAEKQIIMLTIES